MKYIFYFILVISIFFTLIGVLDFFAKPDSMEIAKESTNLALDMLTSNKIFTYLLITAMFVPAFLGIIFKKRH